MWIGPHPHESIHNEISLIGVDSSMGEVRGALAEQNTHFDKTMLSFACVVERYIRPWRSGKQTITHLRYL